MDDAGVTVADVVGQVESGHNPAAIRFEIATDSRAPQYDDAIAIIIACNKCSRDTARMIWASSWGEFQIMGFNLYAPHICGYTKNLAAFLVSAPDQLKTFDDFLTHLKVGFSASDTATVFADANTRAAFARAYNGPGNVLAYADKIASAI